MTGAGQALWPILLALKEWGDRYVNPGEPVIFQHVCGAEFHLLTVCAACNEPVRDGELTVTGDPLGGSHDVEGGVVRGTGIAHTVARRANG
ncbi:hypothetical protein ACFWAY_48115 [Rhodococcus sp. NPDC059968]|uniref:hypothetical protein n=1 Tax=Rhodococcus sp. NPDC059968 TaxID=3347017 RepID=UPI0036716F49